MKNIDHIKKYINARRRNIFILSFLTIFFLLFFYIFYDLPNPYKLKDFQATPLSTQILDRNGKLLYDIYKEQNRTAIKIANLPKYV